MSTLHKNNLYHANLKPSNIFYSTEGNVIHVSEAGFVSQKGKNIQKREIISDFYFRKDKIAILCTWIVRG